MKNNFSIITVHYNSIRFIKLLVYSLEKLTFSNYTLVIVENGSKFSQKEKLIEFTKDYPNIKLLYNNPIYESASYNHAMAVDLALSIIETEIVVICDSDVVFLSKDWDVSLFELFSKNVAVVGFKATGRNDFPQIMLSAYKTEILRNKNISFLPSFQKGEKISQYNDTGYQILNLSSDFDLIGLNYINTRESKNSYFSDIIGVEEYYINHKLIASHFGRGSSSGAAKYFKNFPVPSKLKKLLGLYQIIKWKSKAKDLIIEQLKK
ncbi:glycosyltransferase family 2 protein [Flavobacteriaceae bacterium]|nr:glycosyltransferase family 2 protein [Flavobacteriaceae bacterium]